MVLSIFLPSNLIAVTERECIICFTVEIEFLKSKITRLNLKPPAVEPAEPPTNIKNKSKIWLVEFQ